MTPFFYAPSITWTAFFLQSDGLEELTGGIIPPVKKLNYIEVNLVVETFLPVYQQIIQQVAAIEAGKKEISRSLLLAKKSKDRIPQVYNFLTYDLEKHQLFCYAAIMAINYQEDKIIENIKSFYSHIEETDLLDKIDREIAYVSRYIEILNKEIKNRGSSNFIERRMIQEICKYVMALAHMYNCKKIGV